MKNSNPNLMQDNKTKIEQIESCLAKAEEFFEENDRNRWGIALTNFQYGVFLIYLIEMGGFDKPKNSF